MNKSIKLGIGIVLILIFGYGCANFFKLSDLRTEVAKANTDEEKAIALLREMAEAHQIKNWDTIPTYTAQFSDAFFGFLGKSAHPFKEDSVQMELNYISNTFDGSLKFNTGEQKGEIWGIQSWQTYTKSDNGSPSFEKNKDSFFWLPTYQYFIEFPRRIQKATALNYAGEQIIDGIPCEGILASWNQTSPQKEIDQYLIWLNKETKRIHKLEYTIREEYKFLTGAAYFLEYKTFDGIVLPTYMPVESNLVKKGFMHKMRILDFSANTIDKTDLRPNSELPLVNDSKSTS